uniref:Uncharacterized protein n=1 Tax=Romanomermis culicivorax TaxID=13658 RepID=A0A915L023_ROMCU
MALRINRVHLKILSIFLTLLIVCGGQPIDNLDCPTIVCRCFKISGLVNCSASENLIDIPKNLPEWAQKM